MLRVALSWLSAQPGVDRSHRLAAYVGGWRFFSPASSAAPAHAEGRPWFGKLIPWPLWHHVSRRHWPRVRRRVYEAGRNEWCREARERRDEDGVQRSNRYAHEVGD